MTTASSARGSGPVPPTASIGELDYQDLLREMYVQHHPGVDPEPYVLGMALMRVAAVMRLQMDTRIYQPAGLSIAHVRILVALAAVGPTTPTELARFTQVSPSSISSVLRTLRRNGHVTRDGPDDDADGRVRIVRLTPAGEVAMLELMSDMRELEEFWAQTISPAQRKRLLEILRRMTVALSAGG